MSIPRPSAPAHRRRHRMAHPPTRADRGRRRPSWTRQPWVWRIPSQAHPPSRSGTPKPPAPQVRRRVGCGVRCRPGGRSRPTGARPARHRRRLRASNRQPDHSGSTGSHGADDAASPDTPFSGEVAPLLGGPADPSGTGTPSSTGPVPQHSSTASSGAVSSTAVTGPIVQRTASSAGPVAPAHRSPVTVNRPRRTAAVCPVDRGASDRFVTAREMSLQRMFEPGAAAIASGAAYSDGANSVVFRPPTTNPPVVDSPTRQRDVGQRQ